LPLVARPRHEPAAGAHRRRVRRPVRLPALARPPLSTRIRRPCERGLACLAGGARVTSGQFTGTETLEAPELAAEASALPRGASRLRRMLLAVAPPLVAFAFFVGIWYLVTYVILSPDRRFLMPPAHEVVRNGF